MPDQVSNDSADPAARAPGHAGRAAPALAGHGTARLPSVDVDTYNAELRDADAFVGDRASRGAFCAILDDWRARLREATGGGDWEGCGFSLPGRLRELLPEIDGHDTAVLVHNDAVVHGLSEAPAMRDVERWGVLTIGTGLGNARFTNCPGHRGPTGSGRG
jgi:hypothetical protein